MNVELMVVKATSTYKRGMLLSEPILDQLLLINSQLKIDVIIVSKFNNKVNSIEATLF